MHRIISFFRTFYIGRNEEEYEHREHEEQSTADPQQITPLLTKSLRIKTARAERCLAQKANTHKANYRTENAAYKLRGRKHAPLFLRVTHFARKFQIGRPNKKTGSNAINKMNDDNLNLTWHNAEPERANTHEHAANNKQPFFAKLISEDTAKRITQHRDNAKRHTEQTNEAVHFACIDHLMELRE